MGHFQFRSEAYYLQKLFSSQTTVLMSASIPQRE